MDIGKATPAWLNEWVREVAEEWELFGQIGWLIEYEYAGSMPPQPREDPKDEDLWHVTMFPVPSKDDEGGEVVPDGRVNLLAVQEMMDEVEAVSMAGDGTVRISGRKNKTMVEIDFCCMPPDDVVAHASIHGAG